MRFCVDVESVVHTYKLSRWLYCRLKRRRRIMDSNGGMWITHPGVQIHHQGLENNNWKAFETKCWKDGQSTSHCRKDFVRYRPPGRCRNRSKGLHYWVFPFGFLTTGSMKTPLPFLLEYFLLLYTYYLLGPIVTKFWRGSLRVQVVSANLWYSYLF